MRSIQDDRLKADFKLIVSNIHVSQLFSFIDNYELLLETARKYHPVLENVNNVMIAPQDYDVRHPDESWSSTKEISGYDRQIYPWHVLEHQRRSQEWSSDEALARSDWQPVDWDRSNAQEHHRAVTSLPALRSSTQILTRASMTTKITSVFDGVHLFAISATCPSDVSCDI